MKLGESRTKRKVKTMKSEPVDEHSRADMCVVLFRSEESARAPPTRLLVLKLSIIAMKKGTVSFFLFFAVGVLLAVWLFFDV